MTQLAKLAGLLLLGGTVAAHALDLPSRDLQPRVFFTPAERSHITAQRLQWAQHGVFASSPTAAADGAEAAQAASRRPALLSGITLARDGRASAWIGGRRYEDGAAIAGYHLRIARDGIRLVGARGEGQLLKVGQNVGGVWVAAEPSP